MRPPGALRLAAAGVVSSAFVIGCLFPSFDGLEKSGGGDKTARDAGGGDRSADGSPPASPDGSSSSAAEAGARPSSLGLIDCDGQQCNAATDFCCAGITTDCIALTKSSDCFFATEIHCDGNEDCSAGSVCCFDGSSITCRPSCSGTIVCSGTGRCDSGQCTRPLPDGYKGCQ